MTGQAADVNLELCTAVWRAQAVADFCFRYLSLAAPDRDRHERRCRAL